MNLSRLKYKRRAATAVEVALFLPLLIILTFGLIEYGWLFLKAHQITNAARQAARVAATPDATTADVQAVVNTLMANAGLSGGQYTMTINPGDITEIEPGNSLVVGISVSYTEIKLTGVPLIPTPSQLSSSITMTKEGP